MFERFDFSPRGRARVALWTILGTLGCISVALLFDSASFSTLNATQRLRSVMNDVVLPIVLAGPLLYFFSSKLRELAIAHHQLSIHASTDALTGVLTRGAFTTQVEAKLRRGALGGSALLVIDIDHFKRVNDSCGHDCGDEALRLVADAIGRTLRPADLLGRLGGEEFAVFMSGASVEQATACAERIGASVAALSFAPGGRPHRLSVSVGGTAFDGDASFRELYRAADQLLYRAKENGRDRSIVRPLGEPVTQRAA